MENKEENHEQQPANPPPPQKLLSPPRGPHPAPDPQSPRLDFSSKQDQQKEIPFQHQPPPAAETPVTAATPVFEAEPTSRDQQVEGGGGGDDGHGRSANFKSDLWLCPPEDEVSPTREPGHELSPQSTPLDSPAPEEDDTPPFKPTISSAAETGVAGPTPKTRDQEETVERGHGNGGNENLKPNSWLYPPPERLPPPYYSPKTQAPPLDSTPLEENDTRLTYMPTSPPAAQNPVASATLTIPHKAVPTAQDQGAAKERSRGSSRGQGHVKPNLSILKKARRDSMMKRALLGFRVSGFLICLVSFSVLAADKSSGWALDSFYLYKEFRFIFYYYFKKKKKNLFPSFLLI